MTQQTDKPLIFASLVVLAMGLAAIGGAWIFEIVIDLVPCPLCLQQRWAYYAGLPLALIALMLLFNGTGRGVARGLLAVVAVMFLLNAGLGVYHSGIEWHWWPGPTGCATGAGSPLDAAGLAARMARTRVVACDEAAWRFLGLSLAGYNVLVSLGIVALIGWALAKSQKN
jgi:disulfide bond formation protein DsbB